MGIMDSNDAIRHSIIEIGTNNITINQLKGLSIKKENNLRSKMNGNWLQEDLIDSLIKFDDRLKLPSSPKSISSEFRLVKEITKLG